MITDEESLLDHKSTGITDSETVKGVALPARLSNESGIYIWDRVSSWRLEFRDWLGVTAETQRFPYAIEHTQ